MRSVAFAVADALDSAEPELTALDASAGDGDLGASMQRGAAAIRALPPAAFNTPASLLAALVDALRKAIAGSSGPFYATALLRGAAGLDGKAQPTAGDWLGAYAAAIASVSELGGAKPGDRTMLDALDPAHRAWRQSLEAGDTGARQLAEAAQAASDGAAATAKMAPTLGRAAYLGNRAVGIPDGGARAVAIWLAAIASECQGTA
jgi:dihydroxyacetone kinase